MNDEDILTERMSRIASALDDADLRTDRITLMAMVSLVGSVMAEHADEELVAKDPKDFVQHIAELVAVTALSGVMMTAKGKFPALEGVFVAAGREVIKRSAILDPEGKHRAPLDDAEAILDKVDPPEDTWDED